MLCYAAIIEVLLLQNLQNQISVPTGYRSYLIQRGGPAPVRNYAGVKITTTYSTRPAASLSGAQWLANMSARDVSPPTKLANPDRLTGLLGRRSLSRVSPSPSRMSLVDREVREMLMLVCRRCGWLRLSTTLSRSQCPSRRTRCCTVERKDLVTEGEPTSSERKEKTSSCWKAAGEALMSRASRAAGDAYATRSEGTFEMRWEVGEGSDWRRRRKRE